jgi:[ribosomal protein S5]-alanine N-acetyltransferase
MIIEVPPYGIRAWSADDQESLVRHADDRAVWLNLRDRFPHPYTPADARDWIALASGASPLTNFAICHDDEAIGGIGVELGSDVHRFSAELGYWLGRAWWGRGLMSSLIPPFSRWAMERFGLVRLFAASYDWNPASARVLGKSGFQFEGRLRRSVVKEGRITDQVLYAMIADGKRP